MIENLTLLVRAVWHVAAVSADALLTAWPVTLAAMAVAVWWWRHD